MTYPPPPPTPWSRDPGPRPLSPWWKAFGIVLAVILAVFGLAVIALFVAIFMWSNSSGSNK